MRFRKLPVTIEATRWFKIGDHVAVTQFKWEESFINMCKHCGHGMQYHGWIDTLEGGHIVCPGDWVITGVKGENYPCKPDIFLATYEPAE